MFNYVFTNLSLFTFHLPFLNTVHTLFLIGNYFTHKSLIKISLFGHCCAVLRGFLVVVNVLGHLPALHDVVLGNGADHPRVIGVP